MLISKRDQRSATQLHPFHLVSVSPWPLLTSFSLLNIAIGGVLLFHNQIYGSECLYLNQLNLILFIFCWFRDVSAEGQYLGAHTLVVQRGLSLGFYLFVITEVIFFISLFWAYLHSSLTPAIELGNQWPPTGIQAIDPFSLPLLNTFLLLGSGVSVTYAHHALIGHNRIGALLGLFVTISLAILFTICQILEYFNSDYTISDSVYGSSFFLSTGMHGIHVIIGTTFLIFGILRVYNYQVTANHHVGLEAGILYWHFVDVVWLILFSLIYIWAFI